MKVRQEIYDIYWKFAAERQNIFFNKIKGKRSLTQDPILQKYKFCNVFRASDRVSQFLIRDVIYFKTNFSAEDILFRIFLFRLLNKIETWQLLEKELGTIHLKYFTRNRYSKALDKIKQFKGTIYGNTFILCANKAFGHDKKQDNHLALLESVFVKEKTHTNLVKSKSLRELFRMLIDLPLIGNFMHINLQ